MRSQNVVRLGTLGAQLALVSACSPNYDHTECSPDSACPAGYGCNALLFCERGLVDGGPPSPRCVPSPDVLQARWRGEGNASDETGAYDGIMSGSFTPDGRHGAAFMFDGNQGLTADMSDRLWPAASFSVEAWVQTTLDQRDSAYVVEKYDGGGVDYGDSEYLLEIYGSGGPSFQFRTAGMEMPIVDNATFNINDGQWHHLVGVRDVGQREHRFYVDGKRVMWGQMEGAALGALSDTDGEADPVTIGMGRQSSSTTPKDYYRGAIDDVAIYFSALSDEVVAAIYAAPDGICAR